MIIRINYKNGKHETCFDVMSFRIGDMIDLMGEDTICLTIQYKNLSVQYKYCVEDIKSIDIWTGTDYKLQPMG